MEYNQAVEAPEKSVVVLGYPIIPKTVREAVGKAAVVQWGTHVLRWRYFEVTYEGVTYHRDALIPTAVWHLLKRMYVDQDWPTDTTLEKLNEDARATIESLETETYVYGYYRTDPPRLQWGFCNPATRIAVVYDEEADRVTTVFKPAEGTLFFQRQIAAVQIDRAGWQV